MALDNKQFTYSLCITSIPITQGVINMVHMFAELDKIPPGLKLASQHNVILYDSTWFQE